MVNLIIGESTQQVSLIAIRIVKLLLHASSLLQKSYYVTAATVVQVKLPEGASSEGANDYEPTTLTLAKGTTVRWISAILSLHTVNSRIPDGGSLASLVIWIYDVSKK
ncbi:MAG: hypothetical protein M3530_12425 [Thermoproteota archaeon]|nr:hypothetical protein [Thermoproteota archaeon]